MDVRGSPPSTNPVFRKKMEGEDDNEYKKQEYKHIMGFALIYLFDAILGEHESEQTYEKLVEAGWILPLKMDY